MSSFNIYVTNNSNVSQAYYLMYHVPGITTNYGESPKTYSVVFSASFTIQGDGSTYRFTVPCSYFACCGSEDLQQGPIISTIDNTPMNLDGEQDNIAEMVVVNGGPGFTTSDSGAEAGTFEIAVPSYDSKTYRTSYNPRSTHIFPSWARNSYSNRLAADVWCGIGMPTTPAAAPPDRIHPMNAVPGVRAVVCWNALPAATYHITPGPIFALITGTFEVDQIIDMTDAEAHVGIDYTTQGEKVYASVTHNSDQTFSPVKYSASAPEVKNLV